MSGSQVFTRAWLRCASPCKHKPFSAAIARTTPITRCSARSNGRGASAHFVCWRPMTRSRPGASACSTLSTVSRGQARVTTARRPRDINAIGFHFDKATEESTMSLKAQLAEYRAGWHQRVPAARKAIIQRHIDELRNSAIARTMLQVGDLAPSIVLHNAKGEIVDVGALLDQGPVIVT